MIRLICLSCLVLELVAPAGAAAQLPPTPVPSAQKAAAPRVYVRNRALELGRVIDGDKRQLVWRIENHGDADLIIERATPTCGCTVITLSEEEKRIPPGGYLDLKAVFDSTGRPGKQQKGVTLRTNDPVEPMLPLTFTATVARLMSVSPSRVVNLRAITRGLPCLPVIKLTPGRDYKVIEVVDMSFADDRVALTPMSEPFEPSAGKTGQQITLLAQDDMALGPLTATLHIKVSVDGVARERDISIRGEVVGDLTWLPRVVDHTRIASRFGYRLSPVTIKSNHRKPFLVLGADVTHPDVLGVVVEPDQGGANTSRYAVVMTIKPDAPVGPFGMELRIRTDSADQPLVTIPVFGTVAPAVVMDPPIVVLRQDGTRSGVERRVRVSAAPQAKLELSEVSCDNAAVSVEVDQEGGMRYNHIRFLRVKLDGTLAPGTHRATLRMRTTVTGEKLVELPVLIEVPG